MHLANQIFNKTFFRPGQYELKYEDYLFAKEINSELGFLEEPSAEDKQIMTISLLLASCFTARNMKPEISFPILIDDFFSRISGGREKKVIDFLLNNSQFQVIMTARNSLIDDSRYDNHLADLFHSRYVNAYRLKTNQNYTSATIIHISEDCK